MIARIIAAIVGIGLAALLLTTIVDTASLEDFGYEVAAIADQRWALFALLDRFAGFVLLAIVIVALERSAVSAAIWAAPIFVFGNIWAAVWVIARLPDLISKAKASGGSEGAS
jgi:hypothetical protein